MKGASKAGRPGADDQHVRVQPLAFRAHAMILARKPTRLGAISPEEHTSAHRAPLFFFQGFGEGGDELENISDDAVVGDFKYWRIPIFIDRHDGPRTLD